jgi:hypothetical protein
MTTFGDFETDDAFDTVPAAPEQVAYRIHRYRRYLGQLAGADPGDFFDMTRRQQDDAVAVGAAIVDWVADHPPSDRADLAEAVHGFRQHHDPAIVDWHSLSDDLRAVAEAVAAALAAWLIRQGAWR